jgi:SCF-associated factor 1
MYVWGTLSAHFVTPRDLMGVCVGKLEVGWAMNLDGYSNPCKQAYNPPKRLKLPSSMLSFSCGRNFVTGLDAHHRVWCFRDWGRPFVLKHPVFDATRPDTRVVQVESGWAFGAALTASGSAYVWHPAHDHMGAIWETKRVELDQLRGENGGEDARALAQGSEIQCYTWIMEGFEPLALPELPKLPELHRSDTGAPQPASLVQVAAGNQFLIGLTNGGHVVRLDLHEINDPGGLATLREQFRKNLRRWEYVSR